MTTADGEPIWRPDPAEAAQAAITRFAAAAGRRAGLDLGAYDALQAWPLAAVAGEDAVDDYAALAQFTRFAKGRNRAR